MESPSYARALPGHFYAIGVGPGAPDLLTFRAARLIETADVIVAPRSRQRGTSLALKTVDHLIKDQEVIDHVYAMQRHIEKTLQSWQIVADDIVSACQRGRSAVQITIGDPLIYSTSCYLVPLVREALPSTSVHVVPGISAFQAAASKFSSSLTIQEDRLMLMPASDIDAVERALDQCETLVLYKAGRKLKELESLLERRGLVDQARLVCYAEQQGREYATLNFREGAQELHGYMATVIVHLGRRPWSETDTTPQDPQ